MKANCSIIHISWHTISKMEDNTAHVGVINTEENAT
jgi:hypothetical protein